jgi:hypothetical protein
LVSPRNPNLYRKEQPDVAKVMMTTEIEDLLAGDEDGLAVIYEDHRL